MPNANKLKGNAVNNSDYVVGLLFSADRTKVALIEKTHPDWQRGRLNGVGGKIEPCELPENAMTREFLEEAGCVITKWRYVCVLHHRDRKVLYFCAEGDYEIKSMTDEKVGWYAVADLSKFPVIHNLIFLVPLALDKDNVTAVINDRS